LLKRKRRAHRLCTQPRPVQVITARALASHSLVSSLPVPYSGDDATKKKRREKTKGAKSRTTTTNSEGAMQATKNAITLKGSVEIVSEFFAYAINSILYQRGIYSVDDFRREEHYGLTMFVAKDPELCAYLGHVIGQLQVWLAEGLVQRLVLVVTGLTSKETLERWSFNVETTKPRSGQFVAASPFSWLSPPLPPPFCSPIRARAESSRSRLQTSRPRSVRSSGKSLQASRSCRSSRSHVCVLTPLSLSLAFLPFICAV